ncbi:MAG: hypothetical protein HMLKMBBP_00991 [Planctomycetes bacterium]|nr:hypothetical protein [Planctomycetota bacterium]
MMKKAAAMLLETVQLLLTAFLFTSAFWSCTFMNQVKSAKLVDLDRGTTSLISAGTKEVLLEQGIWVAAGAFIALAVASFLRADMKKVFGLLRLLSGATALMMVLWAGTGLPENLHHRPWNVLFIATGLNLAMTAMMIGGGKGGSSKSAAPSDSKK